MRNFFFKLRILINFIKYKLVFRESKKFLIDFNCNIVGGDLISIGQNFAAKKGLRIEAFGSDNLLKIEIGNFVSLVENVHIGAINKINIGNNVLVGSIIIIIDHNHGKYNGNNQSSPLEIPSRRQLHSNGPINIGDNVWIGDGVVVLSNVTIGKGAIIAANTVVNKNVENFTLVGGNPMRLIKKFNFTNNTWE